MANVIHKPNDEIPDDEPWTFEEAERRMRELLASLPPPIPIEELARQQGVQLPQRWEDLPRWPEDDLDAWEGFDEWLEEFRHGQQELEQRKRSEDPDLP